MYQQSVGVDTFSCTKQLWEYRTHFRCEPTGVVRLALDTNKVTFLCLPLFIFAGSSGSTINTHEPSQVLWESTLMIPTGVGVDTFMYQQLWEWPQISTQN